MIIKCTHCSFIGEPKDFGKHYGLPGKPPNKTCHACRRKADIKYRENNREKYNARVKERRVKTKQWAVEYKGSICCHCNQKFHFSAFDFHHTDPKEKENDLGLMMNSTEEKLKLELDKCILLCANCHRIHHFKEGFK